MIEPHEETGTNLFGRVRTVPVHSDETSTFEPENTAQEKDEQGANPSEPMPEPATSLTEIWLTVDEAVAYCGSQGLSRTAKTIRKWAERSFNIPEGEVVSQREDTLWGRYRWKIEQSSLERKVAEELSREQVQTGANVSEQIASEISGTTPSNPSEQVQTSADTLRAKKAANDRSNTSEPLLEIREDVRTGLDAQPVSTELATLRAENKELLKQQDRDRDEITFLREEVTFNRSLKTDFAQNSHRLLETLETVALGGRLDRGTGRQNADASQDPKPVRYRSADEEGSGV